VYLGLSGCFAALSGQQAAAAARAACCTAVQVTFQLSDVLTQHVAAAAVVSQI
jgi:hypothetical protein